MDKSKIFQILESVKEETLTWAAAQGIVLVHIDYVVPFVKEDDVLGIWIFYKTHESASTYQKNGVSDKVKAFVIEALLAHGYPRAGVDQSNFVFDSEENVKKNFEGSYFYRLR